MKRKCRNVSVRFSDLLAGGLTTGQSMRLQHCPYRRKVETEEDEDQAPGGAGSGPEASPELEPENQEPEVVTEPDNRLYRHWYNMVCYGLPNLMVTLLH